MSVGLAAGVETRPWFSLVSQRSRICVGMLRVGNIGWLSRSCSKSQRKRSRSTPHHRSPISQLSTSQLRRVLRSGMVPILARIRKWTKWFGAWERRCGQAIGIFCIIVKLSTLCGMKDIDGCSFNFVLAKRMARFARVYLASLG